MVDLNKEMGLIDFIRIKHELEAKLGSKVDLVEYSAVKPQIQKQIMALEERLFVWKKSNYIISQSIYLCYTFVPLVVKSINKW